MQGRFRWACIGAPLLACFPTEFPCASEEECTQRPEGMCLDGWCAFPDRSCGSGYAYGKSAGSREGQCAALPDVPTSSTSGPPAPTTSNASTVEPSSTADPGSSDSGPPPTPVCGNNIMEPPEVCDDGNREDDAECNRNCGLPLQPLFSVTWDSATETGERGKAVVVVGERIVVAGRLRLNAPTDKDAAILVVFDLEGTVQWHDQSVCGAGCSNAEINGLAQSSSEGEVIMAGHKDNRAWVALYEVDAAGPGSGFGFSEVTWMVPDAMEVDREARADAVAVDGDLAVVAGSFMVLPEFREPFVAWLEPGEPDTLEVERLPYTGPGGDEGLAVAVVEPGVVRIGGHRNNDVLRHDNDKIALAESYVGRALQATPQVDWGLPGSWITSITATGATPSLVVAGTIRSAAQGRDAAIWRYTEDWGPQWAEPVLALGPDGFDDTAHDVVVDDAGNIIAVGSFATQSEGLNVWIGKYNPDGEEIATAHQDVSSSGGDDEALGVTVDASGNVYVTGFATVAGDTALWLAAYTP